jgi:hypothetical protein
LPAAAFDIVYTAVAVVAPPSVGAPPDPAPPEPAVAPPAPPLPGLEPALPSAPALPPLFVLEPPAPALPALEPASPAVPPAWLSSPPQAPNRQAKETPTQPPITLLRIVDLSTKGQGFTGERAMRPSDEDAAFSKSYDYVRGWFP